MPEKKYIEAIKNLNQPDKLKVLSALISAYENGEDLREKFEYYAHFFAEWNQNK